MKSPARKPSIPAKEEAAVPQNDGRARIRTRWLKDFFAHRIMYIGSVLIGARSRCIELSLW